MSEVLDKIKEISNRGGILLEVLKREKGSANCHIDNIDLAEFSTIYMNKNLSYIIDIRETDKDQIVIIFSSSIFDPYSDTHSIYISNKEIYVQDKCNIYLRSNDGTYLYHIHSPFPTTKTKEDKSENKTKKYIDEILSKDDGYLDQMLLYARYRNESEEIAKIVERYLGTRDLNKIEELFQIMSNVSSVDFARAMWRNATK